MRVVDRTKVELKGYITVGANQPLAWLERHVPIGISLSDGYYD